MNRDNVQQKHRTWQTYVVFLEHEECFPNTKVEIRQIISGQLQKKLPFLLIAGIKALELILNFGYSNKTTCFVLFSCQVSKCHRK